MSERRLAPLDLASGLVVIAVGILALLEASRYPFGRLTHMGPGYVPVVLALALIVLGGAILWQGTTVREEDIPVEWRSIFAVGGGILAFALLIERAGFVAAIFSLIAIAGLAIRPYRYVTMISVAVGLAIFTDLVFVRGLDVPMRAFPAL